MTSSGSQIIVDFWPTHFTSLRFVVIHLCRALSKISSHFNQVDFWALTWPLQHYDTFLFQLFCYRFVGLLGIIVLLHEPSFREFMAD